MTQVFQARRHHDPGERRGRGPEHRDASPDAGTRRLTTAVQLGIEPSKKLTKPRPASSRSSRRSPVIREFRLEDVSAYAIGQTLDVNLSRR